MQKLLLCSIYLCIYCSLMGQPSICGFDPLMTSYCTDACIICDIDGYSGNNNSPIGGDAPPGFCTYIEHNVQWIGFIAASENLTLEIEVSNCYSGPGLEIGIYESFDCNSFNLVSPCYGGAGGQTIQSGTTGTISNTSPLTIGHYYYFVMDGAAGAICDYSISVAEGSTEVPPLEPITSINGATETCPGGSINYSIDPIPGTPQISWFLNGIQVAEGENPSITFPNAGNTELCVEASNICHPAVSYCTTVEVSPIYPTDDYETICPGECLYIQDQIICAAGIYPITYVKPDGCDSTVIFTVDMFPSHFITEEISICEGSSVEVGGNSYDQAGTYNIVLMNSFGCDSSILLDLDILPNSESYSSIEICEGETFEHLGVYYDQSGDYQIVTTSQNGCDSLINFNLMVIESEEVNLQEEICFGESFHFEEEVFEETGVYQLNFEMENGCVGLVNIELNVLDLEESFSIEEICAGDSIKLGTEVFAEEGIYQILLETENGCDSLVNLDLTILPILESFQEVTICEGEGFEVENEMFHTSGYFTIETISETGCDSLIHLDLKVLSPIETTFYASICEGESYEIHGQVYSSEGIHEIPFQAVSGCDSTVVLNLEVLEEYQTTISKTICEDELFHVGNEAFDQSGEYEVLLESGNGCDSLVYLDLSVNPKPEISLFRQICQGDSISINGDHFSENGVYEVLLPSELNCDTILHLSLEVMAPSESFISESICEGDTYFVENQSFNSDGDFQIYTTSLNGCDSIIHLNLSLIPLQNSTISIQICEGDSYQYGGMTLDQTGAYQIAETAPSGCESMINIELEVLDQFETYLVEKVCEGTLIQVGNEWIGAEGQHEVMLSASSGCDSLVYLDLAYHDLTETLINTEICEGESIQIGGTNYFESGSYTKILKDANDCDSLVQLDLTVLPVKESFLSETICEGESFTAGNQDFTETGLFELIFNSADGCDSILLLDLEVLEKAEQYISTSICQGEVFEIANASFETEGQYELGLIANNGCDSTIYLNLEINPVSVGNIQASICEGEVFEIGSESFETGGQYQLTLSNVWGCDSLLNLDLEILSIETSTISEVICLEETYTVGNEVFSETGQYEISLLNLNGCDSIVQLNLEEIPCEVSIDLSHQNLQCAGNDLGKIFFEAQQGTPPIHYTWEKQGASNLSGTGQIELLNQLDSIIHLSAGTYKIIYTDANGFENHIEVVLEEPAPLEVDLEVSDFEGFAVSCYNASDGFLSVEVEGGISPYSFYWQNGEQTNSLDNIGAGFYSLTLTDQNNCTLIVEHNLTQPEPIEYKKLLNQPTCLEETGNYIIEEITGGMPPYLYSLNGMPFTDQSSFQNLTSGNYELLIQDSYGCEVQEFFAVDQAPEFSVSIGEDQFLKLGDSLEIIPDFSIFPDFVSWEGEGISCQNCPSTFVKPTQTSVYKLFASTSDGCLVEDRITIYVQKPYEIYVPNIFSPNDDGINDLLMIHAGLDVDLIESFIVFSRWGEPIFEYHNFSPNDPDFAWDGKHKSKKLNADTFIWMAEVKFSDGATKVFKGDVVLVK